MLSIDAGYGGQLRSRVMSETKRITVVAAVIRDETDQVLLCRRPDHKHMGGLWEFPGGKIEDGESPATALIRELREELGLTVAIEHPLTFAVHEEPGLEILLLFYSADIVSGKPTANEGQEIRWVPSVELPGYPTPPADARLVELLVKGEIP